MAPNGVQDLDRLIERHHMTEDKRAALHRLKPGMSYQ